jgi:hypothetical protein
MARRKAVTVLGVIAALAAAAFPPVAGAAITPTSNAGELAGALNDGAGLTVTGGALVSVPPTGTPNATSDVQMAGFGTAGPTYVILTSGNASFADDPNGGNLSANDTGGAVRGNTDRDVTILRIDVNVPEGANCLTIDFRFFSEEYPEYVGKSFNDAFIAELDASDWTTTGQTITAPRNFAFDPQGKVVSVNATGVASMSAANAAGTTYDGATQTLYASTQVTPGAHQVFLSIFDQGDNVLDSAVFLDRLSAGSVSGGECKTGAAAAPPPGTGTTPTGPAGPPATPPTAGAGPPSQPVVTATGPTTPKPPAFGANGVITGLPSAKKCVSRRSFRIRIRKRRGRTYEYATIALNGVRVVVRRAERVTAPIDLRGLPKGRFTVRITVVTQYSEAISGTRRYRTCTGRRRGSGRPPPL